MKPAKTVLGSDGKTQVFACQTKDCPRPARVRLAKWYMCRECAAETMEEVHKLAQMDTLSND